MDEQGELPQSNELNMENVDGNPSDQDMESVGNNERDDDESDNGSDESDGRDETEDNPSDEEDDNDDNFGEDNGHDSDNQNNEMDNNNDNDDGGDNNENYGNDKGENEGDNGNNNSEGDNADNEGDNGNNDPNNQGDNGNANNENNNNDNEKNQNNANANINDGDNQGEDNHEANGNNDYQGGSDNQNDNNANDNDNQDTDMDGDQGEDNEANQYQNNNDNNGNNDSQGRNDNDNNEGGNHDTNTDNGDQGENNEANEYQNNDDNNGNDGDQGEDNENDNNGDTGDNNQMNEDSNDNNANNDYQSDDDNANDDNENGDQNDDNNDTDMDTDQGEDNKIDEQDMVDHDNHPSNDNRHHDMDTNMESDHLSNEDHDDAAANRFISGDEGSSEKVNHELQMVFDDKEMLAESESAHHDPHNEDDSDSESDSHKKKQDIPSLDADDLERLLYPQYFELPTFFDIDPEDVDGLVNYWKKAGKEHYKDLETKYREIHNYDLKETIMYQDEHHNKKLNYMYDLQSEPGHAWNVDYDYLYPFMIPLEDYDPALLKPDVFAGNLTQFLHDMKQIPSPFISAKWDIYDIFAAHKHRYKRIISKQEMYDKHEAYLRDHYRDVELIFPENDTLLFAMLHRFGERLKAQIVKEENDSGESNHGGRFLRALKKIEDEKDSSSSKPHKRRLEGGFGLFDSKESVDLAGINPDDIGDSTKEDVDHPRMHTFNGFTSDITYLHRNRSTVQYYHNMELDDPQHMFMSGNLNFNDANRIDPEQMIPIVLKVMKTEFVDWTTDWMRHIREAIFLQQLQRWEDEFISMFGAQFESLGQDRAFYFVPELGHCLYPTYITVTPYYDETLRQFTRNGGSKDMTLRDVTVKALQILSGLQVMHNIEGGPYTHTDLQPRQFMIDDGGNVLINDFNRGKFTEYYFASSMEQSDAETDVVIPCTYCMPFSHGHYRAPEEYYSDPLNEALDLWSICYTIWNLFSYEKPWKSVQHNYEAIKYMLHDYQMRSKFPYSMPPYLKDVMRHCWRQNMYDRPNINELMRSFRYFYKHIDTLSDGRQHSTLDQLYKIKAYRETNFPDMDKIKEFT
eukprot:1051666_1